MNALKLLQLRFNAFKAQNHELGAFDVVFDVGGKKLYANKFMLLTVSTTFASMISDRWSSKDEAIPIEAFGYDEFYQFFTFLYSGECLLTSDNIFTMVDIAEFYQVAMFKDYCDEFLSNLECTHENAILLLKMSNKYSLVKLRKTLVYFFSSYLTGVSNSVSKKTLFDIIKLVETTIPAEHIFEKVYVWAEEQGKSKIELDQNLILSRAIKEILADFMPLFDFAKMDACFAVEYLAGKRILRSGPELSDILLKSYSYKCTRVTVKIINKNGRMMKGQLNYPGIFESSHITVYDHAQESRNLLCVSADNNIRWVSSGFYRPSRKMLYPPCDREWYLIYDSDNCLAVKHETKINSKDYLITHLVAEENVVLNSSCKIFATRS